MHNNTVRLIILSWILLFPLMKPYSENIDDHFDLSVSRGKNTNIVFVTITPKRDKKIKGFSEEKPFITVTASGVMFENKGILIRTEYITEPAREVFEFPYQPLDPDLDRTHLEVHLSMTYVPCIISTGLCLFPKTIERDYLLKTPGWVLSTDIINTGILGALFLLACAGLVMYIRIKKDIFFTAFFLLIFSGMLFYTFATADEKGISQAELSRDIARTLCLSCIGIESSQDILPVNMNKTSVYGRLKSPVRITVFSAPWCGTCPFAKAYVDELCSLYPDTLSYEVVDISEPAGKEKYSYYKTIYPFKEPLPLPAIIVSVNKTGVLYGTVNLEENLIKLITGDTDEQD